MIFKFHKNQKIKNIFYYILPFSFDAFALRVSGEDIYGDTLSGGSEFFAILIGLLVLLFFIKTAISDKGLRNGIFLYIGTLLSIILIGKTFGKEITVIYCAGLVVLFFLYEKKITDEKTNQSKNESTKKQF